MGILQEIINLKNRYIMLNQVENMISSIENVWIENKHNPDKSKWFIDKLMKLRVEYIEIEEIYSNTMLDRIFLKDKITRIKNRIKGLLYNPNETI